MKGSMAGVIDELALGARGGYDDIESFDEAIATSGSVSEGSPKRGRGGGIGAAVDSLQMSNDGKVKSAVLT